MEELPRRKIRHVRCHADATPVELEQPDLLIAASLCSTRNFGFLDRAVPSKSVPPIYARSVRTLQRSIRHAWIEKSRC
jgi:hypothetical protein